MAPRQQTTLFDMLYGLVAAKGRESALLGTGIERARTAFERFSVPCDELHLYFEIPLAGEPDFDVLIGMGRAETEAALATKASIAMLPTLTWYHDATRAEGFEDVLLGFELDARTPAIEDAGVYLVQRDHPELAPRFLALAQGPRVSSYAEFQKRMPEGWTSSYVGLFPSRPGSPTRVNAHPLSEAAGHMLDIGPSSLSEALDELGFMQHDDPLATQCFEAMSHARSLDLQFDLYDDGVLGDTLGLELYFGNLPPDAAKALFHEGGHGAQLMQAFERAGLADKRWQLLADAPLAQRVSLPQNGSMREYLVGVHLFSAKVKYRNGVADVAKFYVKADIAAPIN